MKGCTEKSLSTIVKENTSYTKESFYQTFFNDKLQLSRTPKPNKQPFMESRETISKPSKPMLNSVVLPGMLLYLQVVLSIIDMFPPPPSQMKS